MAFFLAAEAMFFAGLISAFVVLRAQTPGWPPLDQPRLPIGVTGLNTLVLLASAWTLNRGRASLARGREGLVRWLAVTALLGSLFLLVQGAEWVRLIRYGLTTRSSLYGATFYTLVGAHGLHVLAALVVLLMLLRRAARGHFPRGEPQRLDPYRMYWFFVVAVWPVLYVLVYLR
jgi:heme/copper-type cytochrome/quinol oxidase subunit 3